ncbi:MAG TPA: M50 family metallopeptidase [Sphingomicrobium sp.]|nr:M50 family metallopeptidase [Sphingomicrobium sp.]
MAAQPPIWLILIAFICAIGPLVFVHELGHYLVARWFGVGAEVFSIGFGREIFGWHDRRGTRWKVGWLPLGGYVRFVGDADVASTGSSKAEIAPELRGHVFNTRPVGQRFLIVLAGPMANFLMAILIFATFFATFGMPHSTNVVDHVMPGSPAQQAGIRAGDRIESIAGLETPTFEALRNVVMLRAGAVVTIRIERGEQPLVLQSRIGSQVIRDEFGQAHRIGLLGIPPPKLTLERPTALELIPKTVAFTFSMVRTMIDGIVQIVNGHISPKELGGPLKIAQIAGQQASLGLFDFVALLAMLSINLGFINLLPVPMLDGGHLAFYTIEAVRRRPVDERAQEWAFRGGLAALLALLVFVTFNDLSSFGLWERLGRLIG